jgi:hypothetical protein
VNHHEPRVQTSIMSRYLAPTPVDDFVLLFLPSCGPHMTPLATGSLDPSLLVSLPLRGPRRLRPFMPTLHLHQHESSRNLHLQYLAKSQSTPHCQSLITPGSDHPPVFGRSGPHRKHQWKPDKNVVTNVELLTQQHTHTLINSNSRDTQRHNAYSHNTLLWSL